MNFCKSILDANNNKGNELPRYTSIKVFAIVPIISLPTFIPHIKSSFIDFVVSTMLISFIVLAIDMATSITAPKVAKSIVDVAIAIKFNSGCAEYKNIECSLLNPVMWANFIVSKESMPAKRILAKHPKIAEELLRLNPPTKYIVIAVEKIHIINVAKIGFSPIKIIGDRSFTIRMQVRKIESKLYIPFFRPT